MICKMSRSIWVFSAVIVVAVAAGEIAAQQTMPRLLHPGTFFESQLEAGIEGEWLALVRYGSRDELESREVIVRPMPDNDNPLLNGIEITVRGLEQDPYALFLIRGIANVSPAAVREARINCDCALPADLALERRVHLSLDGQEYDLEVNPLDRTRSLDRASTVTLRSGDKRQVLYQPSDEPDDTSWPILWAGDLDRDGRLDLYLDLSWKYSVSRRVLFLSSAAAGDSLVGEAAVFQTTGA
jgi:hypothetical protein